MNIVYYMNTLASGNHLKAFPWIQPKFKQYKIGPNLGRCNIQKFLGFANFYHRFIDNYSDIVIPLTRLTRKSNKWNFNDKCRNTFNTLKSAFLSAPILTHWIPDRQITLETDASDYAIGAILSITLPDEEIHPVAFHSP